MEKKGFLEEKRDNLAKSTKQKLDRGTGGKFINKRGNQPTMKGGGKVWKFITS